MRTTIFLATFAAATLFVSSSAIQAAVISLPSGNYDNPNPNDPFENATPGTLTGVGLVGGSSLNDLFGQTVSTVEPGHMIFNGAGQSTFTFTTATPVSIRGYNLYLSGGDGDGRELDSFELLANTGSGFVALGSGAQTITDANYGNGNGGAVLVTDSFTPITASSFEVILDNAALHNLGGRLLELDAVATMPEPSSVVGMIGAATVGLALCVRRYRKASSSKSAI